MTNYLNYRRAFLGTLAILFGAATFGTTAAIAVEPTDALPLRALPHDARTSTDLDRVPYQSPVPSQRAPQRALGDTTYFGYVDANGFAIPGETWTWDHGHPTDPLEGWTVKDVTAKDETYVRHIDATIWNAPENDNLVPPPILAGVGSAWFGAFEAEADTLCWNEGLGYGNSWLERLASPIFDYTGTGSVALEFTYFNDSEVNFDYTRVVLRTLPSGDETVLNGAGFDGGIGLATDHPVSSPTGTTYSTSIEELDFGGDSQFQIVFEFESDGGWSDQDGSYQTDYGPFTVDDLSLTGSLTGSPMTFGFESDLEGWTPESFAGNGAYLLVNDVSLYTLLDACVCNLEANVLAMHDPSGEHPTGQRQHAISNTVDLTTIPNPGSGQRQIMVWWDQYGELANANGVFYRPGWTYYPHTCVETGIVGWSPPTMQSTFIFLSNNPLCTRQLYNGTENGVPGTSEQVRFIYELYSSCDAFGIDPTDCSGETNATPLLDNVQVAVTDTPIAPTLSWDLGYELIDGFSQSNINDPYGPGNADCIFNVNNGNTPPIVLVDAPRLEGPVGTDNPWDARFHFRIRREGPGASHGNFTAWSEWKTRTGAGIGPSGTFASALMDTFEVSGGPINTLDVYDAYYREDDPNNPSPATELVDANEILVDNIPPGTMVEYFASAHYQTTPSEVSLLPDTSGGNFRNFEILPHWRDDGGIWKFPSILYIDAYNRGTEYYVASALDDLGYDYDIFDVLGASCCGNAPFARGPEVVSNNGMTLAQLQGYRAVLYDNGRFNDSMYPEDGILLSDWLTAETCGPVRRGLLANGDGMAESMDGNSSGLLPNRFGATLISDHYFDDGPDGNFCIDIEATSGAMFGTSNAVNGAYDYGAWGNACPEEGRYGILGTHGTGVGNRVYVNTTNGTETSYAQVVNENISANQNYRTVIDGVSWIHLTDRDAGGLDPDCEPTEATIITAITNEIAAAMEWIFDGTIPELTDVTCEPTASSVPGELAGAGQVTRLYANQPNPFNPRTTLRFSLAQSQPATLAIFDVSGRRVRTLIDAELDGGPHEIDWDGTDDAGHALAAGVYWSQLVTDDFRGSKKMIVLD